MHFCGAEGTPIPPGLKLDGANFSISAWLKLDPADAAQNDTACIFLYGKWPAGSTAYNNEIIMLRLDEANSATKKLVYTAFGLNQVVGGELAERVFDGGWHHVALVKRPEAGVELYVDGQMAHWSGIAPDLSKAEKFYVGCGMTPSNAQGRYLKGLIDDVVASSPALSPTELFSGAAVEASRNADYRRMLSAESSVEAYRTGVMKLGGKETVAKIFGESRRAEIRMADGLEVAGNADGSKSKNVWSGRLTGKGDFVKSGAAAELVMKGATVDIEGDVRVEEGVLKVIGERSGGMLAGRWEFDDAADPWADSSDCAFRLSAGPGVSVVEDAERGKVARFSGEGGLSGGLWPDAFPRGDSDYTVAMWIKRDPACQDNAGFVSWGTPESAKAAVWRFTSAHNWMCSNYGNNWNFTRVEGSSKPDIGDGAWHHVAWTREGAAQKVYLDGAVHFSRNSTNPLAVDLSGREFHLGVNGFNGSHNFTGWLDDVQVYNFAANAEEVGTIKSGGTLTGARTTKNVVAPLPEPLYAWSFDDAENPWANTGTMADAQLEAKGSAATVEDAQMGGRVLDLTAEGTMNYLECDLPAGVPRGARPFTASFWAKIVNRPDASECFLYWGKQDVEFVLIGAVDGNGKLRTTYKDRDVNCERVHFDKRGAEAEWHHVAVAYAQDGANSWYGETVVYVDGVEAARSRLQAVKDVGEGTFWIGRKSSSDTVNFKGMMDDVRIYGAKLGADAVRKVMESGAPRRGAPAFGPKTGVKVAQGAAFRVEGENVTVKGLSGAGELAVEDGSLLVAGPGEFTGEATGGGTFGMAEGAEWEIAPGAGPAVLAPNAKFAVAGSGKIALTEPAARYAGEIPLVRAREVVVPEDLSGWTAEGGVRFSLYSKPGEFGVKIKNGGLTIIIR